MMALAMGRKGASKRGGKVAGKSADKASRGKSKKRGAGNRPVKPPVIRRIWTYVVNHPKGVLIGSATLLGLIVVFQNWRSTPAFLLVTDVSLPFIVWALIFMVVGYATGKWLEWAWRQRKIRKGTYKPRVSAEDLADTSEKLGDRLEPSADEGGAPGADEAAAAPYAEPNAGSDGEPGEDLEPATLIDRRGRLPDRDRSGPRAAGAPADRWEEPALGTGTGPEPRISGGRPRGGSRPAPHPEGGRGRPSGDWSPAARQAARDGDRGRRRPAPGPGGGPGRYGDYPDAGPGPGPGRSGGRYADYGDAGRYADYGDAGRYADYDEAGRYGDYADYADYGDAGGGGGGRPGPGDGRYGDYGDYGDAGGGGGGRGASGPAPGPGSGGARRR
jgi:uncharacterized integral membrane protein